MAACPRERDGSAVQAEHLNVQERQPPDADLPETDHVDEVRRQWARERPDLDTGPIAIIARLGRAQAYIDPALDSVFIEHGLTRGSWDVLAALRRTLARNCPAPPDRNGNP